MRWKVRVRGEDGVEEEDGEEEDPTRKPATAEQLAYTQRLLKVRDRYQQALREQHPRAAQYKALMDQANAKANEQQDHAGAIQALQALEKAMDEGGDTGAKQPGSPDTPGTPGTPSASETPVTPTAPPLASDALKAQYAQRLATMEPRVLAVLKAQTGDASKIRAVAEFVREKGDGQNYKAALAGMESLEKLLAAAGTGQVPGPVSGTAKAKAVPHKILSPIWDTASESVVEQAGELIVKMREEGDPELDRMADDLLATVDDKLAELSELLEEFDALTGEEQADVAADLRSAVHRIQRDVAGDRLMAAADQNPAGREHYFGANVARRPPKRDSGNAGLTPRHCPPFPCQRPHHD